MNKQRGYCYLLILIIVVSIVSSVYVQHPNVRADANPPTVTINFAGNLSDSGGPYWRPPGESTQLIGAWSDGYYANDSKQSEGWIYINLTVTDVDGIADIWLNWLNGTTWTNWTYKFTNPSGNWWEINTSNNFSTTEGYDYSFDIISNDTVPNSGTTVWSKIGIDGNTVRRYVQLNCTSENLSYKPLYLYHYTSESGIYGSGDTGKNDRLHHDQGANGTQYDTGYMMLDLPGDNVELRYCSGNVGYFYDDMNCSQEFVLNNAYYHFWWATNSNEIDQVGLLQRRQSLLHHMIGDTDYVYANSASSPSNITYNNSLPLHSNSYHLYSGFHDFSVHFNITDNNLYEVYFDASEENGYISSISNRSFLSFILFNVPDNATLNASYPDSDSDGLSDWEELYMDYTNPFLADTDNDGVTDYGEHISGSDPNNYTDTIGYSMNVTTNTTTGVEEQNATLHGYLVNDSGETCRVGFQWGESTSYGHTDFDLYFTSYWNPLGDIAFKFPKDIWLYNTSIENDCSCENFCTQGGIYDNIEFIFKSPDWKNWAKGVGGATLHSIDNSTDHPTYSYFFKLNNSDWLNFTYDNLTATAGDEFGHQIGIIGGFPQTIYGLAPGTLYHYRAFATNSSGTDYGNDFALLTKPLAPTNFTYLNTSYRALNLSWLNGSGYNHTYIERNNTADWSRGEGTLVYNDTANYYNDTGLASNTTYYYQLWSYTTWTYNPTVHQWSDANLSVTTATSSLDVDPPYDSSFEYNTTTDNLTLYWNRGNYSDKELLVSRNDTYATSPDQAGNWIRQNSTATNWSGIENMTRYYTIWSWNETAYVYSSEKLNMIWGGFVANVMDENYPWIPIVNYTLFITNVGGTETYYATGLSNPTELSYNDIPYGDDTIIQISHPDYRQRVWYVDLIPSLYYNYTLYLPRIEEEGGGEPGDCVLRSYTDSVSITNPAVDAVITLTFTIEDIISVEIYNTSLYETYGGWLFVTSGDYTVYPTNVTISNTILDDNTTMARVSYYYEYCGGIISAIYYIRVVEAYETSSGIFERAVENAKVTFQKYINTTGAYENISVLFTDANGYVNLYLIPSESYRVIITKPGYIMKTSNYLPQPPNEFGQTVEKTFRIERTAAPREPVEDIQMDIMVLSSYNSTTMQIYYLNLNEDNNYVFFSIYDFIGSSLLATYNVSTNPGEISIYFNFSNYSLSGNILRVRARAVRLNGTTYAITKYFNIEQARDRAMSTAPIAAMLSIGICLFGLTIAHPKKTFGFVGIITMIMAIAITAFAEQIWYIHLIQAVEIILLIIIFLIFREEGVHAV